MTPAPDDLEEFRLLREARLPSGFEERLKERLHAVAKESKVVRFNPRRRYPGLLLLVAIVLPLSALAAGGVLLARHFSKTEAPSRPSIGVNRGLEKKSLAVEASGPSSVPSTRVSKMDTVGEGAAAPTKYDGASSAKRFESRRANGKQRTVEATKSEPVTQGALPSSVERAPAKIEVIELEFPKRSRAESNAEVVSERVKRSALRSATEQGSTNSATVERESTSQIRKQAAERRGGDAAQQAQERVQARERKGQ